MRAGRFVWLSVPLVGIIAMTMLAEPRPMAAGVDVAQGSSRGPQQWDLSSPDNRTTIAVMRAPDGQLTWRATRAGAVVIAASPLGLKRSDQDFTTGLTLVRATPVTLVSEDYRTVHGKRREHHVRGRERTLSFTNSNGRRLAVILRAHDDGVAFRYRFPDTDTVAKTVTEEVTGFAIPGGTAWIAPQQPVAQYSPAYEDLYREVPVGTSAPSTDGWAFPGLFHTAAGPWVLVTESGFDGLYSGSHFAQQAPGGLYQLRFPDPGEGNGVGQAQPKAALPWTLPWRVAIIGDAAARIAESDLVNDLAPATRLTDLSWIKPGRAAWSWWSESDSPKSAARLNAFTDLAADMTWEYALVDANWNVMTNGTIADVIAHAKARNVGLLFWYNSGGPHNIVTEAPRDRMLDRLTRRAEMAKLREWGVKGIKVDFWQSDKPDRFLQYRAVLRDAADFQLLVNFHGATIPRGWEREFPHLVGVEAVAGAEQYKFRKDYPEQAAWQNSVLPFTRNVLGTMDYTPVTLSDHQYPHLTTNAHELALSVIFQTGVQHFADSATSYGALPSPAKEFLKRVPAAWDETRVLEGEPGRAVVIARRDGTSWYVAGVAANDATTVRVPLSFLASGTWTMHMVRDGATDRGLAGGDPQVQSTGTLEVSMRARGGFVARLER